MTRLKKGGSAVRAALVSAAPVFPGSSLLIKTSSKSEILLRLVYSSARSVIYRDGEVGASLQCCHFAAATARRDWPGNT